jgi:hypothetical protein
MTDKRHAHARRRGWLALAAAMAAGLGAASPAAAELPAFGMVTVARRQTATLHLVLTHEPDAAHPGCQVTASFVDAQGNTLRDAAGNEYSSRLTLHDNVAADLTLPLVNVLPVGQERMQVRAAVRETPDAGSRSDCCALTMTLEIANRNGSIGELAQPRSPNPPNPICAAAPPPSGER